MIKEIRNSKVDIKEKIHEIYVTRMKNIKSRLDPLTGVSEYPNLNEPWIDKDKNKDNKNNADDYRLSKPFEDVRKWSQDYLNKYKTRPIVVCLLLGKVNDYIDRSIFMKNFLSVAGFIVEEVFISDANEIPSTINKLKEILKNRNIKSMAFCSTDLLYDQWGSEVLDSLPLPEFENLKILWAGKELPCLDEKKRKEKVHNFVFKGSSIYEIILDLWKTIGVMDVMEVKEVTGDKDE